MFSIAIAPFLLNESKPKCSKCPGIFIKRATHAFPFSSPKAYALTLSLSECSINNNILLLISGVEKMSDDFVIDGNVFETASGLLNAFAADLKHQRDGDDVAILKSMGLDVIFSTRDLMFAPMTLAIFEMMGQNGIKNLMFRGGYYAAERFAADTVEAGYAKWDESLIKYFETIAISTGWGMLIHPEISLDAKNPRMISLVKNHPSATTVVKIMESATKKNTGLKIDYNQTFCDYHTGFVLSLFRLIMKNNGADEKFISSIKGKEEYCQAQKGRDHCRHVIGLLG
jgi:hypothetical protein